MIHDAIAAGVSQYGMQTFDMALHKLIVEGRISRETALAAATNPTALDLRLKGVETTSDWRME